MSLIADMSSAEFYVYMAGGQRMLRVSQLSQARTAKDLGRSPSAHVEAARDHNRSYLRYLREYRSAKRREALEHVQNALTLARMEARA